MDRDSEPVAGSCLIIAGNGRSGSNRLLDFLDKSTLTICRNEPNKIVGGEFFDIGHEYLAQGFKHDQLDQLLLALHRATIRRSSRDRLDFKNKTYINRSGKVLLPLMEKQKIRQLLMGLSIIQDQNEWTLHHSFMKPEIFPQSLLVLKLIACPVWAKALIKKSPHIRILHNIRNPIEYLNSWYNRFILNGVGYKSFKQNFSDMPKIFEYFGKPIPTGLDSVTVENLVEVELWRWRYVNEFIYNHAGCSDRYLMVTYADIEHDPKVVLKKVYDFANLTLDDKMLESVHSMKNKLFSKPHTDRLDQALCARLLGKVMTGSTLNTLNLY